MALQSRALTVLLTRPAAQSDRFAANLLARHPGIRIVQSPLMTSDLLRPALPDRAWTGVIFTSETGVLAAKRIAADGVALPKLAFCVGDQTARMASLYGFQAVSAEGDAQALARLVQAQKTGGPLLYLHGAEVRTDLALILNSSGTETVSAICYVQRAQMLTTEAVTILQDPTPVIAPVFSPRTGQILALEYARIDGAAPLFVAAISADAVPDLPGAVVRVAKRPDASALLEAMDLWLA